MAEKAPKIDMTSVVASVRKLYKDDSKRANRIGTGDNLSKLTDSDYLTMPNWWKQVTGVPGLPFGRLVVLAGDSDSGKTSTAIEAMKAAQAQGVGIIYVETEGKTNEADLVRWGVDPSTILLIQSSIAEEAFDLLFSSWDAFKLKYPTTKLLVIFDSLGNVVSQRDATIDLTDQNQRPGGKGQINRLALNKMVSKRDQDGAAVLIISYTYDNLGSVGKTSAGGKSLNFFSSLTFQTSRRGWFEKQVGGIKVRAGADVQWRLYKNHLDRGGTTQKEYVLRISGEGIKVLE